MTTPFTHTPEAVVNVRPCSWCRASVVTHPSSRRNVYCDDCQHQHERALRRERGETLF